MRVVRVGQVGRQHAAQVDLLLAAELEVGAVERGGLARRQLRVRERDVDQLALVPVEDLQRVRRVGVRAVLVGEAVVGGLELGHAVVVQVRERVRERQIGVQRHVDVGVRRLVVAPGLAVVTAVRAAREEVDQHLGLAVGVEVARGDRVERRAAGGPRRAQRLAAVVVQRVVDELLAIAADRHVLVRVVVLAVLRPLVVERQRCADVPRRRGLVLVERVRRRGDRQRQPQYEGSDEQAASHESKLQLPAAMPMDFE